MSRFNQKIVTLSAAALVLASCQRQSSPQQTLQSDIEAQIVATNPCDASSACTRSFTQALLIQSQANAAEFCNELVKKSDAELAICEVDIRNPKFSPVIESCKSALVARLKGLVDSRNVGLKIHADVYGREKMGLNFKFKNRVQTADLSQGYYTTGYDLQPNEVMLTFDDGPESINTMSILKTLEEAGAKAHFFELGFRVEKNPEVTKAIADQGHSIGNHSWDHPNMKNISFEAAVSQIRRTQTLLQKVLGWAEPFFRFPYGSKTTSLEKMLAANQTAIFSWNIDSNDWRMINENKTMRTNLQVVKDTMAQLDQHGRGIILMHDIHRRTAELLPELLRLIAERGYTLVTMQPENAKLKTESSLIYRNTRLGSNEK